MGNNIRTFCLIIITLCVFVMAVIDVMELVQRSSSTISDIPKIDLYNHQTSVTGNTNASVEKSAISFAEMKYDFGELKEGDVVNHTFEFTNTGKNPLIISNAIGSCGCTVPTYPKEPIPPGTTGKIEVQFNSKGKNGLQNKTVTVTANTEPQNTVLTITSNVIKAE